MAELKLTPIERLSLLNQFRILNRIEPNEGWAETVSILEGGFSNEYSTLLDYLGTELPADEGDFVLAVLVMYEAMQHAVPVVEDGERDLYVFPGFDGNNEGAYLAYYKHIIDIQRRWDYLRRGRDLNSHFPTLERYRRMLARFREMNVAIHELTPDQAVELIQLRD
ncbi:YfbU family protein [Brucella pituitosa]